MTVNELSRLQYLQKLIDQNFRRLLELEYRLQLVTQLLTDTPHVLSVEEHIGELMPLIADLQQQVGEKLKEYFKERMKVDAFIYSINNYQLRFIMYLRFVDLKTWGQIAAEVGGGNTEESGKKLCYRFLKAKDEKERKPCDSCLA